MAKKMYIGVNNFEKRNLPSGYTQLDSIKSDGTQHFNTGFIPNQNTRVVCKAIYTQGSTATYLFGSDGGSGVAYFAFGSANGNLRLAYNTSSYYFTTGLSFTDVITIDVNKNVATINGTHSVTATSATFNSGYPLYLFADNRAGEVYGATPAEICAFEIYDNGTLVRDYVPCKNSSGAIGLYDMVNDTFGTGSGGFTAGSVTQQNVAREVKKIYAGVSGVARKVKTGYLGVNGVARKFFETKVPVGNLEVGDIVLIDVNEVSTEFIVVQIGIPQGGAYEYDDSCDGVWLLMKDAYISMAWHSTARNVYAESDVHAYLNNTFLPLLDKDIQSAVIEAKIPYWAASGLGPSITEGSNGLSAKIFLLAYDEVTDYLWDDCDPRIEYFAAGASRLVYFNGTAVDWWTRQPITSSTSSVYYFTGRFEITFAV